VDLFMIVFFGVFLSVVIIRILGRQNKHGRSGDGRPSTGFPITGDVNTPGAPLGPPQINPATGLLMVGGFDTAGNPFGTSGASQINPATGLPMVGGVDVAGNPFGSAPSS